MDKIKFNQEVYTFRRYFNGDIIPIKGLIKCYFENTVDIETEIGMLHNIRFEDVYLPEELDKLKEKIKLLELARLPKEIEILERDLAHKKRKLNKLLKGEQNEQ